MSLLNQGCRFWPERPRQIAAELYISAKAVEFHLAQILARLAVETRTQIADALAAAPRTRPGPAAHTTPSSDD